MMNIRRWTTTFDSEHILEFEGTALKIASRPENEEGRAQGCLTEPRLFDWFQKEEGVWYAKKRT
jgi:hypothetical protein